MENYILSGKETVYFATHDRSSREPNVIHQVATGPMYGPLLPSIIDLGHAYTKQGKVYRLDEKGNSVLLWASRTGYTKPEYDPEYVRYLELRQKYDAVQLQDAHSNS